MLATSVKARVERDKLFPSWDTQGVRHPATTKAYIGCKCPYCLIRTKTSILDAIAGRNWCSDEVGNFSKT